MIERQIGNKFKHEILHFFVVEQIYTALEQYNLFCKTMIMGQKRDNDDALKRMKSKKKEKQVEENKPTGKVLKIKEKHD